MRYCHFLCLFNPQIHDALPGSIRVLSLSRPKDFNVMRPDWKTGTRSHRHARAEFLCMV